MLSCEIINCAVEGTAVRYDVRVELAGVYEETVGYTADLPPEPTAAFHNRVQSLARQYALREVSKSVSANLLRLIGKEEEPKPTPKRRRRTKAESEGALRRSHADQDRRLGC
jgi:hypothetical protein